MIAEYDLIISCDVFVYLGDLQEVFSKAYDSLTKDGLFCFSTELLGEQASSPFLLQECARFAHKQSYIENLANQVGFVIVASKVCKLRKNNGKDVVGLLSIYGRR
jgi:predicted TPR repeat methyltransferase